MKLSAITFNIHQYITDIYLDTMHKGYQWQDTKAKSDLTHWGRVTHICVSRLTITGSDNGLSPGRRQAIIWTNTGILLIGPLGTNFSEYQIEILTFSFTKMRLKVSSAKWRPFCLGFKVLITWWTGASGRDGNHWYLIWRLWSQTILTYIMT